MDLSKLNEIDLSDIDINDIKKIGSAPTAVKFILILLLCIIAGGATVTFDEKQSKAANLEAYAQQLKEMEQDFGALKRQLPSKTEIESLLTDISQTGIASGLEIQYFKPEGLFPKEFYAEFPIKLRVIGRYHEFGKFVSGVAALPRIVTMRNISIRKPKNSKDSGVLLEMEVTAVTYQYLDEQEDV